MSSRKQLVVVIACFMNDDPGNMQMIHPNESNKSTNNNKMLCVVGKISTDSKCRWLLASSDIFLKKTFSKTKCYFQLILWYLRYTYSVKPMCAKRYTHL